LSEAQKIRDKYGKIMASEISQLQRTCPHTEISDWMDESWPLEHPTGRRIRRCLRCDMVMEVREPNSSAFADPFNVVEREQEQENPAA
jgi:hypothetical protein